MITKEQIQEIITPSLTGEKFLVDVIVNPGNKIVVTIDAYNGLPLDECVHISRIINECLDREVEDYELEVTSPGLTAAFKVTEQYTKNQGKQVDILLKNGEKLICKLVSVDEKGINIEKENTIIPEGKKKKTKVVENQYIEFNDIKHTKLVLTF